MTNLVIPVTQARKYFLILVDRVDAEYTRVDITKSGRVKATLISSDYLEALEESLFTREHSMEAIRQSEQELAKGKYVSLEEYLAKANAGKTSLNTPKRSKTRR